MRHKPYPKRKSKSPIQKNEFLTTKELQFILTSKEETLQNSSVNKFQVNKMEK